MFNTKKAKKFKQYFVLNNCSAKNANFPLFEGMKICEIPRPDKKNGVSAYFAKGFYLFYRMWYFQLCLNVARFAVFDLG